MKPESRHLLRLPAALRVKAYKSFCTNTTLSKDPRISRLGRVNHDEYAVLKRQLRYADESNRMLLPQPDYWQ